MGEPQKIASYLFQSSFGWLCLCVLSRNIFEIQNTEMNFFVYANVIREKYFNALLIFYFLSQKKLH